jgi:hypothetical protein
LCRWFFIVAAGLFLPGKSKARLAVTRPRLHKYTTILNNYAMLVLKIARKSIWAGQEEVSDGSNHPPWYFGAQMTAA